MKKTCPRCKETKELTFENFYRSKQTKSGFRSWCKLCVNKSNSAYDKKNPAQLTRRVLKSRNRSDEAKQRHVEAVTKHRRANYAKYRATKVATTYGVSKTWYLEKLAEVEGRCEICGVTHLTPAHPKYLAVDHNHDTGSIRGLLCSECNLGLGKFKDNRRLLQKAAAYLGKYDEKSDTCQPISYQGKQEDGGSGSGTDGEDVQG